MSHELLKLTSKLCNTPHLVTEEYLDKVFDILGQRNQGAAFGAVADSQKPRKRTIQYFPETALGVIDIHGAISDVPYYGMCGEDGVSHQSIREEMKALVDAGAKVVVMDSDTNGGLAHMAFESANYIRNLADDNGVKLISYVSHKSFSAGYVYSAVAHEVITNPSSEVGSIGVMMKLRNVNGAMKNMGIEDVYVTAGDNKVPFDKNGDFTPEFLAEVEAGVLELYDQFTGHVAMWRGLDQPAVIALGANSYTAKKALASGLVDKQMTLEEFKTYLDELTSGNTMASPTANLFNKPKATQLSKEAAMPDQNVELQAALEAVTADFTAQLEAKDKATAASLASLKADLEAAQASLAAVEKEKADAKQASRLSELTALFGTEEAPKLAASFAALDDAAFSLTVGILASRAVKEEEKLQTETGADGVVVVDEPVSYAQAAIAAVQQLNSKKQGK